MKKNPDKDLTVAQQIATKFFPQQNTLSIKILGVGDSNVNYLVENSNPKIVIKLSKSYREYKAYEEYKKEAWCIKKAEKLGIPTPTILDVGRQHSRAYQIQTYVEGTPVADLDGTSTFSKAVKLKVWHKLGEYTKLINSIPTTGWGENLVDETGKFADSWEKYILYNINSLNKNDELIKMGVLTIKTSDKLRNIFQSLQNKKFSFGLCHNDTALRNTIIDSHGKIYLLDWGTARAEIVPHCDLNEILSASRPDEKTLQTFLDGYGISKENFEQMKPDLHALKILNAVDKLRWALDKKPENFQDYVVQAKEAINLLESDLPFIKKP